MQITYKTSVASSNSWRIEVNELEVFFPINGEIEFTRDINTAILKVLYIISAFNGTEVVISYECTDSTGKNFEDSSKKSPHKKIVPSANRTQVTLNIPLV